MFACLFVLRCDITPGRSGGRTRSARLRNIRNERDRRQRAGKLCHSCVEQIRFNFRSVRKNFLKKQKKKKTTSFQFRKLSWITPFAEKRTLMNGVLARLNNVLLFQLYCQRFGLN